MPGRSSMLPSCPVRMGFYAPNTEGILLREAFPDLVNAVESRVELHELTEILRDLLGEELSIRDLRGILEALLTMRRPFETDESKGITFSPRTMDGLRIYLDQS